ncbi:MFS transporter [Kitasatospora sp. NBC_00240]|uniref:MFS transporter n=1 Tax=Kitasatospora sp. NBC_00240 TaxID=2903567 RepID=UPI0022595C2C|nr:MFS transporter [Kitasatospora sp. NBC_00240]MCX5210091.1 MFS transporter [Kitasatospora sp. NBC_00240]
MSVRGQTEQAGGATAERAEVAPGWLVARGLIPVAGPKRVLAAATFVNMIGKGLFMTGAALFFTRSVGIPVTQVGLGLGIAALIGLVAGIPVGHLADRRGPRGVYRIALVVQAFALAALLLVHDFRWLVVCMSLVELANSAGTAARGPLTRALGAPNPTHFRSYLRALNNIAAGIGALTAGVVVQLDTRAAYVALILGNAASFLICAALASRLPALAPVEAAPVEAAPVEAAPVEAAPVEAAPVEAAPVEAAPGEAATGETATGETATGETATGSGPWIALRDKPYLLLTGLDGIMSIQTQVLIFALPLWIIGHTTAPRWFVGAGVAVNTVLVVCLQVRASRGIDGNMAAGRTVRRAGVAFLVALALFAASGGVPRWVAMTVIAAGVIVYTVGELWHTAASFELSFGLAPAHAQGQYSGLYGIGQGLSSAVGPPLLGMVCIGLGWPGWLAMGLVFLLVGLLMPSVVTWSDRTRKRTVALDTGA